MKKTAAILLILILATISGVLEAAGQAAGTSGGEAGGPNAPAGLADTPWPMYQHDPQHTGRSPFAGPGQQPVLLWKQKVSTDCIGESGGISIALDGDLMISFSGCLIRYDPDERKIEWSKEIGPNRSVPLIAEDSTFYIGHGFSFSQLGAYGNTIWTAILDDNFIFGSSSVFGLDGNLFFGHDGVWSFTPAGNYRWYIPYGWVGSHASPAVGPDGRIYSSGEGVEVCAYQPGGTIDWCLDDPEVIAFDRTPAIAADGSIYIPSDDGGLLAVTPAGERNWLYLAAGVPAGNYTFQNGIGIAPDGTLYAGLTEPNTSSILAIASNGARNWRKEFPFNPLTGFPPGGGHPMTVDRNGNLYVCLANSHCYGVSPQGDTLWDVEFELIDSIINMGGVQPLIGADGLIYIMDAHGWLYAYADPEMYNYLTSAADHIRLEAAPSAEPFTHTLALGASTPPISYTAVISPSGWITLSQPTGSAPAGLELSIDPSGLTLGDHRAWLKLWSPGNIGPVYDIPVTLNVSNSRLYLPALIKPSGNLSHRVYFYSSWFTDTQAASVSQSGDSRLAHLHGLNGNPAANSASPDGKAVALEYYEDDAYTIRLYDIRTAELIHTIAAFPYNKYPAWSPDGWEIAFVGYQAFGDTITQVYRVRRDGSELRQVTFGDLDIRELFWSPTGEQIAMRVSWSTSYVMNADGSDMREIASGPGIEHVAGWSPDGRYMLVYYRPTLYGDDELRVVDPQTFAYRTIANDADVTQNPVWSPDGTKIAYIASWNSAWDCFVVNADGSGQINLTNTPNRQEAQPAWSPDSVYISFSSRDSTTLDEKNWDIFVVQADGKNARQITTNLGPDNSSWWIP